MAKALDVMRYIKSKHTPSGEVQLQKLVYYSQAWTLAWDGVPLFADRVEAWELGPVIPSIYRRTDGPSPDVLTPAERANVDAVVEYYGRFHGAGLTAMSHDERPWKVAWAKRVGDRWGSEEITHNSMRQFYTEVALAGDGPKRHASLAAANDEDVLQVARVDAERWRETLAILAQ